MQFLILTLILLTVTFNAVGQISGKVLDKKTGNSIYGVIFTNEQGEIISLTDRKGAFLISEIEGLFTLSALGYQDTTIKISNADKADFWEIGLIPKTYDLPEVFITDKHRESELFNIEKRRIRTFNFFSLGSTVGGSTKIGTRFKNQSAGTLSSVSVYFSEVGSLTNYQLMRLRIFGINSEGEPEEDLLRSLVVLRPKEAGWYDIHLNEFNVPLLGTDFLIAIEFIQRRYDKSNLKSEINANPFAVGFTRLRPRDRSEPLFYTKTNKGQWRSLTWPSLPLIWAEAIIDDKD